MKEEEEEDKEGKKKRRTTFYASIVLGLVRIRQGSTLNRNLQRRIKLF